MVIQSNLDPWEEIRAGRADQAGANIYWLYSGIQKNDLKLIATTLKTIIKREEWRRWRWIGQEFECQSLRECLLRHPPKGIGADIPVLRRLIYDDKQALDMLDAALQNPVGSNQYPSEKDKDLFEPVDNVNTLSRPTGNAIEYALRRLRADDRPLAKELHTKVLAGELSPHRAAVLAGYRKELTPMEQIQKLWAKLDQTARMKHLEWTLVHCATCGHEGQWTMKDGSNRPTGSYCDACCKESSKSL
jgi:hypothetical protein